MPHHAVFVNANHMIQFLHQQANGQNGNDAEPLFESHCHYNHAQSTWSVTIPASRAKQNGFKKLVENIGGKIEDGKPEGKRDWLSTVLIHALQPADPPPALNEDDHRTYLLFADTPQKNQCLVDAIVGFLMTDIQAQPVVCITPADHMYWRVTGKYLPRTVAGYADAIWEEIPADESSSVYEKIFVFREYGCDLLLDHRLVYRFDWNEEILAQPHHHHSDLWYILLSRQGIRYVQIPSEGPRSLIDVARLKVAQVLNPTVQHHTPAPAPQQRLEVSLRLFADDRQQDNPEQRLAALMRDIKQRQEYYNSLRQRLVELGEAPYEPLEPLFLYRENETGPIERLLVDFPDQPEGLRSLYYARETLGDTLDHPLSGTYHVLTTAHALHRSADTSVAPGMRLQRYHPESGGQVRFDLLPDWAKYGLRLYVPHDQRLMLVPRFELSEIQNEGTARDIVSALASALLVGLTDAGSYRDWIFLLLADENHHVAVIRLPVEHFKPLLQVFDWQPNFGRYSPPGDTARLATELETIYDDTIATALHDSIAIHTEQKIHQLQVKLSASLKAHEDQLDELQSRLNMLMSEKTEVEQQLNAASVVIIEARQTRREIISVLEAIRQALAQLLTGIDQQFNTLQQINTRWRQHRNTLVDKLAALRQAIVAIQRQLRELSDNVEEHLRPLEDFSHDFESSMLTMLSDIESMLDDLEENNRAARHPFAALRRWFGLRRRAVNLKRIRREVKQLRTTVRRNMSALNNRLGTVTHHASQVNTAVTSLDGVINAITELHDSMPDTLEPVDDIMSQAQEAITELGHTLETARLVRTTIENTLNGLRQADRLSAP